MNRDDLKFAVSSSSAKTFAMQMTWLDEVLSFALAVAAGGLAFKWGGETSVDYRLWLAILAAVSTYSVFVAVRTLVPFVLKHLSFANMMRLRLSFYCWIVSLVVVAGLRGASDLFSTVSPASVQLTLVLATVMLVIRFFQRGSLLRLVLAHSCAGGAVGISALGVLAPAATILLLRFMAGKVLDATGFSCWEDRPHSDVVDYFSDPLVRSRIKWLFAGCFIGCCDLALFLTLRGTGGISNAVHAWLDCIGLDGAVFLLVTAITPLVVGLSKVGPASDMIGHSDFGDLNVYLAIAPFTALFMLQPGIIVTLLAKFGLHIEPNELALASVIYVFNALLAGVVVLADIRCRDFCGLEGVHAGRLRGVMNFSFAVISLLPLLLLAAAVYLTLKGVGLRVEGLGFGV